MNHKREITDHTAVEELVFNNIWQQERAHKACSLKLLLHGIAWSFFFFLKKPFSEGGCELWKLLEINSRQTHKTPVSSMGACKPELLIASHKSLTPLFCHQVAGLHFCVGFVTLQSVEGVTPSLFNHVNALKLGKIVCLKVMRKKKVEVEKKIAWIFTHIRVNWLFSEI